MIGWVESSGPLSVSDTPPLALMTHHTLTVNGIAGDLIGCTVTLTATDVYEDVVISALVEGVDWARGASTATAAAALATAINALQIAAGHNVAATSVVTSSGTGTRSLAITSDAPVDLTIALTGGSHQFVSAGSTIPTAGSPTWQLSCQYDDANQVAESTTPLTISAAYQIAFAQPGGEYVFADTMTYTLGTGASVVDVTEHVVGGYSRSWQEGMQYGSVEVELDGTAYHAYDKVSISKGTVITIDAIVRGADIGSSKTKRRFTGLIDHVIVDDGPRGESTTRLSCVTLEAYMSRTTFFGSYSLLARPYNCVQAREYDECRLVAISGSTTTVRILAGIVFIDRTGTGRYTGAEVDSIFIPEQVVDLTTAELTDEDKFGPKSIFVDSAGTVRALDGGPPPNGVSLYGWDHLYAGMPMTAERFRDARVRAVGPWYRKRSRMLKLFVEDFVTANPDIASLLDPDEIVTPAENDDEVFNDVIWDRPFRELLVQYAEPSRWVPSVTHGGVLTFRLDRTLQLAESNAKYYYTAHNWTKLDIEFQDEDAVADITYLGLRRDNRGLERRDEVRVDKIRMEVEEGDVASGALHGGQVLKYSDRKHARLKTVEVGRTVRSFLGLTQYQTLSKWWRRRNPLNHHAQTTAGATSAEVGLNHLYEQPMLVYDEKKLEREVYRDRVKLGTDAQIWKMINPLNYDSGSAIQYDRDEAGGGGALYYGWTYRQEQLELVSRNMERYDLTPAALIQAKRREMWALANPDVNGEDGGGTRRFSPQGNSPMQGIYKAMEKEEMIKTGESSETFQELDDDMLGIRAVDRTFRKAAAGNTHSVSSARSIGGMAEQGTLEAANKVSYETRKGRLEAAPALQDLIVKTPVGYRAFSAVVAAELKSNKADVTQHRFAETTDQCERLARRALGRKLAHTWVLKDAGFNPDIDPYDTIHASFVTPGGRLYQSVGLVVGIYEGRPAGKGEPPTATYRLLIDIFSIRATLLTRD